ncbi:MAG: reverse transcriptase domain-containing protein [Clostridium sp.]|uniref:reverse transcriptase domain-containing protein n=1 Tax=Clostridium sp. TaxID=1506 RepID=UPI003D6CACCC
MRNPQVILDILKEKTVKEDFKFDRIFRLLCNPELYMLAYNKLKSVEGNMTKGVDNKTIDGFCIDDIDEIIKKLKDESYQPNPVKRRYIEKKNGKLRPLGIPSFRDKLIQEVVKNILESIYEPTFNDSSHGFRPNRSCHTALAYTKNYFSGTIWWIEGDIKSFFDNIDHSILIRILGKKIIDTKFLRLIYKFLRAGYMEDWVYHKTFSGTPQGGIISPLLANIYLNEFDSFVVRLKQEVDSGEKRAINGDWNKVNKKIYRRRIKFKSPSLTTEQRTQLSREIKDLELQRSSTPSRDPFDNSFRRIKFVRYADDWLIGVIGSKSDAQDIKNKVANFLLEELHLELSAEKTLITHNANPVRFLGYDLSVQEGFRKECRDGNIKKVHSGNISFFLPYECMREFLMKNKFIKIEENNNWKAVHKATLVNLDDLEIISYYNASVRGYYNYYKYANNIYKFASARYLARLSWGRTMANKYKTSVIKIFNKYSKDGVIGVTYQTKDGTKFRPFHNNSIEKVPLTKFIAHTEDINPNLQMYLARTSTLARLLAKECEYCGKKIGKFEVHHIRKLKDLKGKAFWEQLMISRHRKQLVLCHECHVKLHNGTL